MAGRRSNSGARGRRGSGRTGGGGAAEGRVRDLARGGDAVVETEGGLVFVPGALPGELVRIRLEAPRGGTTHGSLIKVLEASEHRVEPECAHASRCGGCPMMHASPDHEGDIKLGWLRATMERLSADCEPSMHRPELRHGYRARARLAWRRQGKAPAVIGYRKPRSHSLREIDTCLVLGETLAALLAPLRADLAPHLQGEGEIALALGQGGRATLVMRTADPQPPELYAACEMWTGSGQVAGISLSSDEALKPAIWGNASERPRAFDGSELVGSVGGFSQAHTGLNPELVAYANGLAQTADQRVLELHAGHGNFSVALARGAESYTAVEQDPAAVAALGENARARNLAVHIITGRAEDHIGRGALDVAFLDPPRTGARGILPALIERKPERIIYVSCDLATLERDVREVSGRGYVVDAAAAFDMFPRTAQLETVTRLVRRG